MRKLKQQQQQKWSVYSRHKIEKRKIEIRHDLFKEYLKIFLNFVNRKWYLEWNLIVYIYIYIYIDAKTILKYTKFMNWTKIKLRMQKRQICQRLKILEKQEKK